MFSLEMQILYTLLYLEDLSGQMVITEEATFIQHFENVLSCFCTYQWEGRFFVKEQTLVPCSIMDQTKTLKKKKILVRSAAFSKRYRKMILHSQVFSRLSTPSTKEHQIGGVESQTFKCSFHITKLRKASPVFLFITILFLQEQPNTSSKGGRVLVCFCVLGLS